MALGAVDLLLAGPRDQLCGARSDVVRGMPSPLVCTRAAGHTDRRDTAEHVASGPHESRLPIAVGAWIDGGAPRIYEAARHIPHLPRTAEILGGTP